MAEPQSPRNLEWTSNDGLLHITRDRYNGACLFRFENGDHDITSIKGAIHRRIHYFWFDKVGGSWLASSSCPAHEFDVKLVVRDHSSIFINHYVVTIKRKSCLKHMLKVKKPIV